MINISPLEFILVSFILASFLACVIYLFFSKKFQNFQLQNENYNLQESLNRIKLQNNELQKNTREIHEIKIINHNLEKRNCAIINENLNNRTQNNRLEKETRDLSDSLRRARLANNYHKCCNNSIADCCCCQDLRSQISNLKTTREESIRIIAENSEKIRNLRENTDRLTDENNNLKLEIVRLKASEVAHAISLREHNFDQTCLLNPVQRIEQWSLANETIKTRNNIIKIRIQTLQNQINQLRNLNIENTNLTTELNKLSTDLDNFKDAFSGLDVPPNMPINLNLF